MNNIDDLKRKWKSIDINAGETAPRINPAGRVPRSIKERLVNRLQRMLFVVLIGLLITPSSIRALHTPGWFAWCYAGFFIVAGAFNLVLIRRLNKFDFATATALDAIDFVTATTRLRSIFQLILISLAVGLMVIITIFTYNPNEPELLISVITGAVLGALLGWRINRRFKRDFALLKQWLGNADNPGSGSR